MKHIKLFEQFERLGTQPLSSKQLAIYNPYIKEKYPYLNIDILSDIFFDGITFHIGDTEYESIEELIEKKVSDLFELCNIDFYTMNNSYYTINNGLIDIDGTVEISAKELKRIPLKFCHIKGSFFCQNNQLTTLEGAPQSVGGNFYCYSNQLTTLEGAPQSVGGYFNCWNNKLTNLKFLPKEIGGKIVCNNNLDLKDFSDVSKAMMKKIKF
jgi:hypothetical protein